MRKKYIKTLFIVFFITIFFKYIFCFDIKTKLEELYSAEKNFTIKKHIKLALQYYEKGFKKSFLEEIRLLAQIKSEYRDIISQLGTEFNTDMTDNGFSNSSNENKKSFLINKFEKVNKYYKESKLSNAIVELQSILELDKENKTAIQMLNNIKEEEFVFDDSKPFQNLVKELYDKGMVFYRKGSYKDAIEKFEKAKELDPTNTFVKRFLNLSRERLINIKRKEDEDRLIEEANKLRTEGEIKKSRSLYEKVYTYNKNNKQAEFYLNEFNRISDELYKEAFELKNNDKLKEAYSKVKEALEFNEKNFPASNLEKELKMKLAVYNERERIQKKVNQLYNKGVSCFEKGNYECACKYWEEVLKINPDDEQTKKNIEIAKERVKEFEIKKETKIKKLISEAEILIGQGLLEKAKSKYEYVLRLDGDNLKAIQGIKKIEELNMIKVGEKIEKR